MQSKQLLLLCSAMITIAYSFPTGTEHITTTSLPQNETSTLDTKGNKRPFIFIMEEKDSKSDSVIVQFVYSSNGGNSIIESNRSNKDKYTVDPKHKGKHEEKSNINEKEKEKLVQELNKKKLAQQKRNEPKPNSTKYVQMMAETSLTKDEKSPLSGKWSKYLNDALNPIPSFPELQFEKPNKINTNKVQKENVDSYLPYPIKERIEQQNVAGPQLYPLSKYDREFNVPIFD